MGERFTFRGLGDTAPLARWLGARTYTAAGLYTTHGHPIIALWSFTSSRKNAKPQREGTIVVTNHALVEQVEQIARDHAKATESPGAFNLKG